MPRVRPDHDLGRMVEAYVRTAHSGNKAGASEALSVTRPVLYRALKGAVTKATAANLRAKLSNKGFVQPVTGAEPAEDRATLDSDIPDIALQVLRFMTQAVQHERSPKRGGRDA